MYVLIVTHVELTCGEPPEVSHATVKTTGARYMDKATYTCATGYQGDGQQHVLVCSTDAKWEADKISCTGKTAFLRTCDILLKFWFQNNILMIKSLGNIKNTNAKRIC